MKTEQDKKRERFIKKGRKLVIAALREAKEKIEKDCVPQDSSSPEYGSKSSSPKS